MRHHHEAQHSQAQSVRNLHNEDKEEISNFEFFVDNILYMVNCRVTKWRTHGSKELLSQCFTVSDEAFGLLMAENYVEIWEKQLNENDKLKWRKEIGEPKYSSSNRGQRCSDEMSWKTEGIRRYYELCHMVSERRKSEQGGKALEEFILEKKQPKKQPTRWYRCNWRMYLRSIMERGTRLCLVNKK